MTYYKLAHCSKGAQCARNGENASKNSQPSAAQCARFYLAVLIGRIFRDFLSIVFLFQTTIIHYSML
jgi:hypothetical protein